jgi:hypothetical protein
MVGIEVRKLPRRPQASLPAKGLLERVYFRMWPSCFHTPIVYVLLLVSDLRRSLNILLSETYSLVGRIRFRHATLNFCQVTHSYSSSSPTERLTLNSYNHARSACISEMATRYPWASLVDLRLVLEGWDRGEKWASQTYNPGSCSEQLVSGTSPFGEYIPPGPSGAISN